MTEKFLNRPNVVAGFQQVRREAVPQGMAGGVFGDSSTARRTPNRFLNDSFVDVVTPLDVYALVEVPATGRKYELPTPLGLRVRILPRYRVG